MAIRPKLIDNTAFLMAMGAGSRIEIHAAAAQKDSWTQITQDARAGDRTLTLAETTGWQVGDSIAIAPSGFDRGDTESRTITAVSADGRTVTLDRPLDHDHSALVETHDNGAGREWDLDMRAEVALLSRNVTLQGDADSSQDGLGGHMMVMNGASMHIDGAELTRMGQEGVIGRYPLHWHMLGDASGQYVSNSSIHDTYNKGVTIHGTQNTWLEDNAIVGTVGHAFYFEDGSEFGNVLTGNLGMDTRAAPSVSAAAIGSDHTAVSTYWVTNPDNHLIDNHAAGSDEVGFWILSQDEVEGSSAASGLYRDYEPKAQTPGQWIGNVSHSNGADGIFIGRQFNERTGAHAGDPHLEQLFQLTDFTSYKNEEVAIWVRNAGGTLTDVKVAESNKGAQIWGSSIVEDSLFVGRTANFETRPGGEFHGWELYDHASHFDGVHFAGFDGPLDAAIAQGHGWGKSGNNSAENLTFGDDVPEGNVFRTKNAFVWGTDGRFDGDGTVAGALHDLTGSLSGVPGAIITPGIVDVFPNEKIDILTPAFPGIEASGFNAAQGAIWDAARLAWVNPPGSVIGKVEYNESSNPAAREEFTLTRSDNGASILFGRDAQGQSSRGQFNVDGSGSVEYEIAYTDRLPDVIDMEVHHLPRGASAIYRFRDLPADSVVQDATPVRTLADLRAAEETVWFRDAAGDFVVKVYADRYFGRDSSRSDDALVEGESFSDAFRIVIAGRANARPSDNRAPQDAPADYWGEVAPSPLPERAASTSRTVEISPGDPRWSDAATWDGAAPGGNDIVVIGPGQRVVLDSSATVRAILVDGGALVVEDARDMALAADWILVLDGGLFQVGTEDAPFAHDFDLTLEGDDPAADVDVAAILAGAAGPVVRAADLTIAPGPDPVPPADPVPDPEPLPRPDPEPAPEPEPQPDPQPDPGPRPEPPLSNPEEGNPMATTITFRSVNTDTDTIATNPLASGATLGADALGIIAEPGFAAGSARFFLDGALVRTENVAPYALFGDKSGDFAGGTIADGAHTLQVVFYSGSGGSGSVLDMAEIDFTVGGSGTQPPEVEPPVVEPPTDEPPTDEPPVEEPPRTGFPAGNAPIAPDSLVAWADEVTFHFDGNNYDEDDIAAMPVAALLAASAGIADRTTFFYGNNITARNDQRDGGGRAEALEASAETARALGIEANGYQKAASYTSPQDLAVTTQKLVDILNSGKKVLAIEGGPMEAIYRALEQVDPVNHSNIKLLSHSNWNNTQDDINVPGVTQARTWADIGRDFPNVERLQINDQNATRNPDAGFYNQNWAQLGTSGEPILEAARTAMEGAAVHGRGEKINDASDAGMMWYALTGDERGTAQLALPYIKGSGLLDPVTDPAIDPAVDPVDPGPEPVPSAEDPEQPSDDTRLTLETGHDSPLESAVYDPQTGQLDLVLDYDRLLQSGGEWGNARHIDAIVVNGQVYPLEIHPDDGPRDAQGRYIYSEETMENTFSLEIGPGLAARGGALDFTLTDNANGTNPLYGFSLVAGDAPADQTPPEQPTGPVGDAPGGETNLVLAVNAGGGAYTASTGVTYEADSFGNGNTYATGAQIAGTVDDTLYQSERWLAGGFTYDIPVADGTYLVQLNFAEIWGGASSAGGRVFDVLIEDQTVADNLDIASEAGFNTALDLLALVEVADGSLTLTTSNEVQNPKIAAFSIWEADGVTDLTDLSNLADEFALI